MNVNSNIPSSELPKAAMDEIPTPKEDAMTITGLVKESGSVTGYRLSDNRLVSREEGIHLARNGQIRGVGIAHNGDTEYPKSLPDDTEDNNLSNLPTVNQSDLDEALK